MGFRGQWNARTKEEVGVAVFDDGLLLVRAAPQKARKLLFMTGGGLGGAAGAMRRIKEIDERIASVATLETAREAATALGGAATVIPAEAITKVALKKAKLTIDGGADPITMQYGGRENRTDRIESLLRGVLGDRVERA